MYRDVLLSLVLKSGRKASFPKRIRFHKRNGARRIGGWQVPKAIASRARELDRSTVQMQLFESKTEGLIRPWA